MDDIKIKDIKLYNIKPELYISKNIALVGNSDNLLSSKYGKVIDNFDDIMRFNYGDLNKDITGLKTTIRWINCPIDIYSAKEHNTNVNSTAELKKYTNKLFTDTSIICWDSLKKKMSMINNEYKFYTPNEMCVFGNINSYLDIIGVKHKFEVVNNCWPRTGFQAILTCIRSGCKPHLFGFDIDQRKVIKHYSLNSNYNVDKMTQHQIDNEIVILKELEDKGLIIVYR